MGASSAASFKQSLWYETAQEPAILGTSFPGSMDVDVAIVGGGFAGCSAALTLAESGASVALFESQEIGFGASGRNGGQVIPGAKYDPSELIAKFGQERGDAIANAVGGAPDLVFDLITRHDICCSPKRAGWIQAAHAPMALKRVLQRAEEWRQRGVDVEVLDAATLAKRTGVHGYCGGWRDPRAGTIQPLSFVRGLARAAIAAGAQIFPQSPVRSMKQEEGRWLLTLPQGEVRARAVVVGTDAYSDDRLVPGLSRSLLLVQSIQLATEVLPDELAKRILPGGECISETRRLAFYFRRSPDGRLVFGGRGAVGDALRPNLFDSLLGAMKRMIPELADIKITHRWSGQVGLTLDGLPPIHEPAPGLFVGGGYNGRGIALATLMGQWLAYRAHAGTPPPLERTKLAPIPWHAARKPIIAAGIAWAWTQDRMGFGS